MAIDSSHLLKLLEPTVRPGRSPASTAKPQSALEHQSFDLLLAMASKGEMHSGRQIELGFEAQPPLMPSQLERLAAAADQAEAAGAKQALMLIDGRGFTLDVRNRTLTGELSAAEASRMKTTDAAVFVAANDEAQSSASNVISSKALQGLMPAALSPKILAARGNGFAQQKPHHPTH